MATNNIKENIFWYRGLISGMNQSVNPAIIADNEANYLLNIVTDTVGCWSTRLGTSKIGGTLSGTDEGYGLFAYNTTAGVHTLMAVTDRDLWAYTEGTTTWATIDTDEWPADTRVSGINFLNRLYLGSSDGATALAYTTGGAVSDVAPVIGGDKLAVVKSTLAVGGNSIKPNIVFYTDPFTHTFHSATDTAAAGSTAATLVATTSGTFEPDMVGAIAYNTTDGAMAMITAYTSGTQVTLDTTINDTWDGDTFYVLQNNFKLDNACTGIVGYQEDFVIFDEDKMYVFDPLSNYSRDIGSFGCINHRTIQVLNGYLIWVNRNGVWLWDGTNMPQDITPKIKDKINGHGLWDLVNPSNFSTICAGIKENDGKYYLSVGTLQTHSGAFGSALTGTVLEFDVKKNAWIVRSYPDTIYDFTTFINSTGNKDLYGIHSTKAWVAKLDTGTTDALEAGTTQAISYEIDTQYYTLGSPLVEHKVDKYYFKYIASADITVKVSLDRATPVALRTLSSSSTITTAWGHPRADQEAVEHGLQFTGSGQVVLEGYGFRTTDQSTLRKVSVT